MIPFCLPVFAALSVWGLLSAPADARGTSFERFRFDAAKGTLELRGDGEKPSWTIVRESSRLTYLEFPGSTPLGRTQAMSPRHPSVSRLLFAQNRQGVVRLAIVGDRLPRIEPVLTPSGKGWRVVLQLAAPGSSSRPVKRPANKVEQADDPRRQRRNAWMGPATFDPRNGLITFPYYGADPNWLIQDAEGHVVFAEFPGASGAKASWLGKTKAFNPRHAYVQRILVAQNRPGVVRLGVRGSVPIGMEVTRRRQGDHWLLTARPYPLPTPSPTPIPAPTPTPTPEPTPLPTPEPLVRPVPTPSPSPEPVKPVVEPDRPFHMPPPRVSSTYGLLTEAIGAESVSLRVDDLLSVGIDWEPSWGDWSFPMHVGQQGYQFINSDYPGMLHRRQVTLAALAVERRYRWANLEMASGLGYQGRWAAVSSTAQAPVQPAPSTLWFSPALNLHGIELRQSLDAEVLPALGLGLDLHWTPWVAFEAQGPAMPWLTRLSLEPRMSLGPNHGVVIGGFADAVIDPGSLGGAFQQLQAGVRLQYDFGPLGRDSEDEQ